MSKFIKLVFIVCILFCSNFSFSQNQNKVKEILTKVEKTYYSDNDLSLNLDYKLYTSYSSKVVSESYKGHIINNNKSIYLKIHNTEFLQTSSRSIKINHDQKMVAVFNKPDIESNVNPMSLSILLKNYKTQDLIDKGDYWICSLQTGKYTQMIYGKIEIYVNKQSYQVEKQVFYILEKAPYKDSKGNEKFDFPRLEITFKKAVLNESVKKEIFNLNNYIQINGDKILPSKKYSNYTIQNI